ncbi:hypothetical protein STTU_2437 [Streptomyces sp. Tu6071]|nr:hypothetical protein STTU_2437 [Streptomyces sp. Tu6071]
MGAPSANGGSRGRPPDVHRALTTCYCPPRPERTASQRNRVGTSPNNAERRTAGKTAAEDLIKSETPKGKRKGRRAGPGTGKHRGNQVREDLVESETRNTEGKTPGGKPERVSTKEASVP